ncbi:MAG: peroxiredoxin-like family protein [Dehalococcoidia bacterium]|nr:peroxiredoxin-like family protein [Dehalococcoidia bacterium]
MADETVNRLANLEILDGNAASTRMGDLWAEQPVVLVLIRHFGCLFCKEQVAELSKVTDRIHAAGGELVIVGNGGPEHVQWFVEDFGVQTPVYTDPEAQAYRAVGAKRGLLTAMNPGSIRAALGARRKGYKQTQTMGDAWQQGGVFIILPDGSMPFRYVSDYAGDHPDPERVVSALEGAVRKAA